MQTPAEQISAILNACDDWELADAANAIRAHYKGYDLGEEDVAQRIRDDAEPRGNCDQICDERREGRSYWGMVA